jgi:uncharacterized alkaline shock family protein YloU
MLCITYYRKDVLKMKVFDKLISFIFSLAMLSIAVVVILLVLDMAQLDTIIYLIDNYLLNDNYYFIVLGIAILVLLAGIKTTIFLSDFKTKDRTPIVVESEKGLVEIERDTIETIVRTVAKGFPEVRDVQARMFKKDKGIKTYVAISVIQDANIKEVTDKIQTKVKDTVFATTGLNVYNTNIKVKNIYEPRVKRFDQEDKNAASKTEQEIKQPSENTQENKQEVQE